MARAALADRTSLPHLSSEMWGTRVPVRSETLRLSLLAGGGASRFLDCLVDLGRFANTLDGIYGPAVAADQRVPAHDRELLQHLQAVAEIADPSARVVRPAHWNFVDLVAPF